MGLSIFASNDLQELLQQVTARFKETPLPPLEQEWLVVQSRGMARWLDLSFARQLGIAASIQYSLPKAFCFRLTDRILPIGDEPGVPIFEDRQAMEWALLSVLPQILETEEFSPVKAYLQDDSSWLKRFQLAHRVAECFDDYQLYRPKMLQAWEAAPPAPAVLPHEAWQRQWWLGLRESSTSLPLHLRLLAAVDRLKDTGSFVGFPKRITLFGVGSLPPLFLEFLSQLSQSCPVALYVVTPTDAFWGHLRSERQQLLLGHTDTDAMETGHELLASLGRQGKDFFNLLQHIDLSGQAWKPLSFRTPPRKTLLENLQADITELRHRVDGSFDPPIRVEKGDTSLQIHVCHGILREVEVIHNLVLDALETMPDLHLQDIVVMVPKIGDYAAAMQAVFGKGPDDPTYLPFTIADQPLGDEFPLAKALVTILETLSGRLTAESVFGLFETSALRNRFQIQEADLEVIRDWIFAAGIVWAEDAGQRQREFHLPEFGEGTWRNGLDRLLLSYAMGESTAVFDKLAPLPTATTSHAILLGHFVAFAETLFQLRASFHTSRTLSEWAEHLTHTLSLLFLPESEAEEDALQAIRDTCTRLTEVGQQFLPQQKMSLTLILETLRQLLKEEPLGTGFISGKITFCALKPMRTIPFKLIVLAGLNDGEFPRLATPASFDLISAQKQPGDRNIREDDRYLFLEAILAAKAKLVLTYIGHHPATLQSLPPSSVVQELLANLDRGFRTPEGHPISQQIVIHHPTSPYDRAYFAADRPKLFSYQETHFQAAMATPVQKLPPFLTQPLAHILPPDQASLSTLIRFWEHPSKFFCDTVLNLKVPWEKEQFPDSETLDVNSLTGYQLDTRIFECKINDAEILTPVLLQSEGLLPPGSLGQAHFDLRVASSQALVDAYQQQAHLPPLPFELELEGFLLSGNLENLTREGLAFFVPAKMKAKRWVSIWLNHLVLQTFLEVDFPFPRTSKVFSHDDKMLDELQPVANAEALLVQLTKLFQQGHQQPLPFFGPTSFAFAESHFKGKSLKLDTEWAPSYQVYNPMRDDFYNRLCFGHHATYEQKPPEAHQALALTFWEPFLQARGTKK